MTEITLEHLELSARSSMILENCGIKTIQDLQNITANTIRGQRLCGQKCINEIRERLAFYGLALAGDIVIQSKAGIELIKEIPELLIRLKAQVQDLQYQVKDVADILDRIRVSQEG